MPYSTREERLRYAQAYRDGHKDRLNSALRNKRAKIKAAKPPKQKQDSHAKSVAKKLYHAEHYQLNRDRIRARQTATKLANLATLAGRPRPDACEECGRLGSLTRSSNSRIVFDHCHKNGWFRGWICERCNKILGLCEDDPELLLKLAAYLRKHEVNHSPQQALSIKFP